MSKYKIIVDALSYRASSSINSKRVGTLKKGVVISVSTTKKVTEIQKSTKQKVSITWGKFNYNGKAYWCSINSKYVQKQTVDYGARVGSGAETLAKDIAKKKISHVPGAYWYSGKKVNCAVFVSYALYAAGCNPDKVLLNHTGKSLSNTNKIKHYEWHHPNCVYSKLPAKYKADGCVYGYASNVAIKYGNHIWSCNSTGKKYDEVSDIRHSSGYNFAHKVLIVGVPKKE